MKKLYTLLLLAIAFNSSATVYSHSLSKNVYSPDSYDLDLDNNGTPDFTFTWNNAGIGSWTCIVVPLNGNKVNNGPLDKTDEVSYSIDWTTDTVIVFNANTSYMSYSIGSYIGLKLNVGGGQFCYGYVNISAYNYDELKVLLCGYNSTPSGKIEAGDIGIDNFVPAIAANNPDIYSSGCACIINNLTDSYKGSTVTLLGMAGRTLTETIVTGHNAIINYPLTSEGIYVVRLRSKNGSAINRKILVNR